MKKVFIILMLAMFSLSFVYGNDEEIIVGVETFNLTEEEYIELFEDDGNGSSGSSALIETEIEEFQRLIAENEMNLEELEAEESLEDFIFEDRKDLETKPQNEILFPNGDRYDSLESKISFLQTGIIVLSIIVVFLIFFILLFLRRK